MNTTESILRALTLKIMGDRDLTPDTHFINDCGADSLDMVDLVLAVEDEFEIELTDEDAESVNTYGDMVKLVEAKLADN